MGRCIIIAPLYRGEEQELLKKQPGDLVICADGGYDAAVRWGIRPDLVIGDFDSMPLSHVADTPVIRLPVHKDDTDMVVCLREGRARGYREFLLAGCLGGRLDHTLSNLQCLYDCALRGEQAWILDGQNRAAVLLPGAYELPVVPGRYLSLIAWSERVKGICLKGTEWQLEDAELTNRFPLGCSNWIKEDPVTLSFTEGALLLSWSGDRHREKDVSGEEKG